MFFLFLFLTFALYVEKAFSQSSSQLIATVWEFGTNRLLGGQFTQPLLPLGTAADGSATTYLWQVLNPVVTVFTSNGAPVLTTSLAAGSRTVVVSPSGYVEPFGPGSFVQCQFIDATEGECFGETGTTVFGAPTPITLAVDTAVPTTPTSLTDTSSQTQAPGSNTGSITPPTSTASSSQATSSPAKKTPVGAIAGGIVAGVLVVSALLILFLWFRRRRQRINRGLPSNSSEKAAVVDSFTLTQTPNFVPVRSIQTTTITSSSVTESSAFAPSAIEIGSPRSPNETAVWFRSSLDDVEINEVDWGRIPLRFRRRESLLHGIVQVPNAGALESLGEEWASSQLRKDYSQPQAVESLIFLIASQDITSNYNLSLSRPHSTKRSSSANVAFFFCFCPMWGYQSYKRVYLVNTDTTAAGKPTPVVFNTVCILCNHQTGRIAGSQIRVRDIMELPSYARPETEKRT
ncbi:hypothetical protein BDP27DRAFT_1358348 [Rhodocollybia butyracea]|uniref:Uncharacterized protein n=1 Tax=Rhodocollybia butyracea TaxID=206335 RepID=A0A9P5UD05_9AGAR|nr:hypothetical protein BDP27DRAFT_1358348 [Rhodocollybia butyracea]